MIKRDPLHTAHKPNLDVVDPTTELYEIEAFLDVDVATELEIRGSELDVDVATELDNLGTEAERETGAEKETDVLRA